MTAQTSSTANHSNKTHRRWSPHGARRYRGMALLVAAAMIAGMVAAAASTGVGAAESEHQQSEEQTEEQVPFSVRSYAAEFSVSLEEAERRLDRIQPIQELLAAIRDAEGTRVAGWGIDHAGTFGGWVWLTGNEPPSAQAQQTADAHADVRIRLGADHSYAELQAAQDTLFNDIGPTGNVGSDPLAEIERMVTYTGINMEANAIRIGIDPGLLTTKVPGDLDDPGPVTITDEAFQTKATEVTKQLQNTINVAYNIEDGRGLSHHATFGGGEQIGGCTAGFAARRNGVYGIITAGHCNRNMSMHGITLPHVIGYASSRADAQFHKIPTGASHRLRDDYLCASANVPPPRRWCDVTGTTTRQSMISRDRQIGEYVCHTGMRSGISCGTVQEIDYAFRNSRTCRTADGTYTSCDSVFVRVEGPSLKGCGGDSGGPWYRNGVAYGIHTGGRGGTCSTKADHLVFSAIDEVRRHLEIEILIRGSVTIN